MSDEDGLISRWSKRKRAAATDEERKPQNEADPDPGAAAAPDEESVPQAEESEADILARFNLPDPDSLGPGDDYKGFMQAGVPDAIRRRALRKLWTSNPVLANLDGLNDYDEDFTSPEETAAVLKTAYKVGRGFLRDALDDSAEQDVADAQTSADAPPAEADEPTAEGRADPASAPAEAPPHNPSAPDEVAREPASPRPRRMRFDS